ncbi:MAG: PAS domain S-box protein [Thermoplasmatota archaeon]
MTDERMKGIRTKLIARSETISINWFNAVISSNDNNENKAELQERIRNLTSDAIEIIVKKQYEQQKALSTGMELASISHLNTDIIGRTVEVLTYELTRDLTPEELHHIHPNLSSLIAAMSMGFFNEMERSILEEQERVKEILLRDLLLADARLREVNDKLEARVQQRTFELNRLNEELKQQIRERTIAEKKLRDRENLLSVILDSSMVWIGLLDNEGRFLLTSRESLEFHGGKPSDVLGKPFWDMPWWDHSETIKNRVRDAILEAGRGRPSKFDVYHLDKSGNKVDVEFSIRPVRDEDGRVAYLIPEGVNITQRKKREKELELSRDRLLGLLENTKDILFSFDGRGLITFIGPQVENFGYSRKDMIGKGIERVIALLHPEDRGKATAMLKRRLQEKDDTPMVYRVVDHEGNIHWVEENVMIITDEGGKVSSVNGVIRDVTDRKRIEEELIKVNEVLRLVNRIMRHDIKNRLSAAYGILGILVEKEQVDRELLGEALRSVESTIGITRRMEELESLMQLREAGEKRSLADLIKAATVDHRIKTSIRGDCTVSVDDAFISVVENLVSNSIMHGGASSVRFDIREKGNVCRLKVTDDGGGVPDDVKELIFEESFSWGPNKGTGLGLFIARKVIESYGGSIMVEDNRPKGARFIIHIPAAQE